MTVIAVSRKARGTSRAKLAVVNGEHWHAGDAVSAVQNRLGWKPARVQPGAGGAWFAYHAKVVARDEIARNAR